MKPKIFSWPIEERCSVENTNLLIECPSFLSILVTHATLGRDLQYKTNLCDGSKNYISVSCLDDSATLLLREHCKGRHRCNYNVNSSTSDFTGTGCERARKELRAQTMCGKYFLLNVQ